MKLDETDQLYLIEYKSSWTKTYLQLVPESIDKDGKTQIDVGPAHIGPDIDLDVWKVEKAIGKKYRIRNTAEGAKACYLTVCGKKDNKCHLACAPFNDGEDKEAQFWEFELGKGLKYQIKSNEGLYLDESADSGHLLPHPESEDDFKDGQQWRIKPYEPKIRRAKVGQGLMEAPLLSKFCGEIYGQNHEEYPEKIKQYASSSYPLAHMSPFAVLYPENTCDISRVVKYAAEVNKKVVVRSGGHQYSGKSSGGDDTILISMDRFNNLEYLGDNIVSVEPCCKLKDVAKKFANYGITVPHGQCPLVNIGGHVQTGGYGHLLRGFGLILDYVHDFDIVLADGSLRTITRPAVDSNPTTEKEKFNQQMFRGVLSGNAGSYGVVTRYTLHAIRDKDHPRSYGYAKSRRYHPEVFKNLLKVVQDWTRKIQDGKDDELRGLDFMMSIKTLEAPFVDKIPMMVAQCVYADPDGGVPYSGQFDKIKQIAESNYQFGNISLGFFLGNFDEERSLSQCSKSFVRHFPELTLDGRQFNYPYKKRINATNKSLTNQFIDAFCQKVDHLCSAEPKVNLIFQMGVGGGQTRKKGEQTVNGLSVTGIPHRNILFSFVFDLFYEEGGEVRAEEIQEEMQAIIDKHYNHGQERRLFWGSFGNTNMAEREVIKMYYDNQEQYQVFQELKAKVDKGDLFHTSFTVQLPGTTKD